MRTTFNITQTPMYPMSPMRGGYTRIGAYNNGFGFPGSYTQTITEHQSTLETLGQLIGTMERENPGTLKSAGKWITGTAFPAIGKAATWVWNGITSLFSKSSNA